MRNLHWVVAGLGAIVLAGLHSEFATAQPAAAPAAPMTLWNYLGIPQGTNKIRDAVSNRSGNRPDAERTNRLMRIADPANLDPSMPSSIQTAAKIKQQEDLAPQKIKAIKYLATVGCGCYQKMGVREALLDSLDDCTEEVRYEAALAFAKVAGTCCDSCGNSCCNAKVMNKLKELADGTDDRCCPKEPSERVRQAARQALNACKNKLPATNVTPSTGGIETPKPKVEGLESPIPQPPPATPTPTPAPGKRSLEVPAPMENPPPVPNPPAAPTPAPKVGYLPAPAVAIEPRGSAVTGPNFELRTSIWAIDAQPSTAAQPSDAGPQSQTGATNAIARPLAGPTPASPIRMRMDIGGNEQGNAVAEIQAGSNSWGQDR